ncbi:uncharacterized protein LOC124154366 [Ischnura elegans]|uniref:uncharacterized protein LOC124154366 n=1 Tax=Ischnura elegans TaxID=197161 RepID=UPI001ED87E1E|nr:uncharacterized protein LOC124154366 [Ischnura elegans]
MSNRHFIIFGILTALLAVASTDESTASEDELPTHADQDPVFEECRKIAMNHVETVNSCVENLFSDESLNETRRLRSDTTCLKCSHMCRKQEEIKDCLMQSEKYLVPLSNRSKIMVPIVRQFMEEGLTSLCEIEPSLSHVIEHKNDSVCLRQNKKCASFMRIVNDAEYVALCDSSNPNYNYTDASVLCRAFNGFLECIENSAGDCSQDGKSAVASIKSQLRNMPSCSEFLSSSET